MLRLTGKYPVLEHIAAFAVAWVAASYLFLHVLRPITVQQPDPGYHIDTLGKGETAVRNIIYLSDALRRGKTIVILGSSELDRVLWNPYTPNLFFPQHHLARVYTYGRAGFETLGMYGLLYGVKPHLNANSRLVIMLSPVWFRTTDLQVANFSDNFNDTILLQDYWSDGVRSVFHDYLTSHQFEFSNMTDTQQMYLDDPSSILDWYLPGFLMRTVNARAYSQRVKLDLRLSRLSKDSSADSYSAGNGADLPWDRYEENARSLEAAHMTNNPLWVRDNFYRLYSSSDGWKHRQYYPPNMNPEPEIAALRELLQMLQRSKVKALFIMQPINPKLYDDVHRFDDLNARIGGLCREYGMHYMDMYSQPYEQGILRDGTHPGALGWERIDLEIERFFRL
ncbi:MAG: D-alanyl-lipoteichoic acid biosynthesis protein DltD [Bacillota bacterium]